MPFVNRTERRQTVFGAFCFVLQLVRTFVVVCLVQVLVRAVEKPLMLLLQLDCLVSECKLLMLLGVHQFGVEHRPLIPTQLMHEVVVVLLGDDLCLKTMLVINVLSCSHSKLFLVSLLVDE